MKKFWILAVLLLVVALAACAPAPTNYTNDGDTSSNQVSTATYEPAVQPTAIASQATATHIPSVIDVNEIVAIRAVTRTVSEFLSELNENFDQHWFSEVSGAWGSREATAGYTVQGPSLFWTDLYDNPLSAGTTRIRTQGGWGIYHVAAGSSYRIPHNNGGGRWIQLNANLPGATACLSDFAYVVGGEATTVLASVTFMDDNTNASTQYTHGSVTIPNNNVAIVWTDWHGDPPATFFPLTPYSTEGGWGVWVSVTPQMFQMPQGGGGVTFLENCSF